MNLLEKIAAADRRRPESPDKVKTTALFAKINESAIGVRDLLDLGRKKFEASPLDLEKITAIESTLEQSEVEIGKITDYNEQARQLLQEKLAIINGLCQELRDLVIEN